MSLSTLTWNEFVKESEEFIKISESLDDTWILQKKNDDEGGCFLMYKQKITCNTIKLEAAPLENEESGLVSAENSLLAPLDTLQIEYHIVYSISYQVPMLYFHAHKSDGSLLGLENAWRIFRTYDDTSSTDPTRSDMLSILTQMEHPVLFKPFLALHPCRTAELLAQAGTSRNRVLTFISMMGPYLHLDLRNEYGLEYKEIK